MVYLDNNATTPLHPQIKEKIIEALDLYGNPSSTYAWGRLIRSHLEKARIETANFLKCLPEEIIFTSGGSEANNAVLRSIALDTVTHAYRSVKKMHIISTKIEHLSVLNTLKILEKQNIIDVDYLDVDKYGLVNPVDVEKAIRPETILISVMWANNELGTIQPIEELSAIANKHKILFHTDAVQAIGKLPVDLSKLNIDYLSLSGHKIYAPKGIGVLYAKKSAKKLYPLIAGGHQEHSLRAGTENTIGILALGEAFRLLNLEMEQEIEHIKKLRARFEKAIFELAPDAKLNGHKDKRLPGTLNISFRNFKGEDIVSRLDAQGIAASTGSACSSGSLEPSHVLIALGEETEIANGSVRFSFGRENTEEDLEMAIKAIKDAIQFLKIMSLKKEN